METVELCRLSDPDVPHPMWTQLGATAWRSAETVSVRDAVRKLGHGSTAGAKLVAAGVLPTVTAPGYQNPRVSMGTVDFLHDLPALTRDDLASCATTLIVRCGGPGREGAATPGYDPETGRRYYGFHRTMTRRQAVLGGAAWWPIAPRTLGLPGRRLVPGERLSTDLTDLWVTVGGLVVLHVGIEHAVTSADPVTGTARPLVALVVGDARQERTGTWLPPTTSGNTVLRATSW